MPISPPQPPQSSPPGTDPSGGSAASPGGSTNTVIPGGSPGPSLNDTGSKTLNLPMYTSVAAPPASGSPQAPADYKPLSGDDVKKLRKLTQHQLIALAGVANELLHWASYPQDFGPYPPSQLNLVGWLELLDGWHNEAARAKAYSAFADDQARQLTDQFLREVYPSFEKAMKLELGRNQAVRDGLKDTAAFVGARSEASQRAAETRKEKKKAAIKQEKAAKSQPK